MLDELPFDEPTDTSTRRRMPNQHRIPQPHQRPVVNLRRSDPSLYPAQAAPEGAPRSLDDIPARFRSLGEMVKPRLR